MSSKKILRFLRIVALLPLLPIIGIPDGDPPAEPPKDPPPKDPPAEPPKDPPADPEPPEDSAEVAELKRQLEQQRDKVKKAESALDLTKSENAKLKGAQREQMTKEEQLAEREKELAEQATELQRKINRATAREELSTLALTEKEITDEELELFVDADEALTRARCQYVVNLVKSREVHAGKMERDKIDKENPKPSGSGGTPPPEDFQAQYNKAKEAKNQGEMIRIKRIAHEKGITVY